MNSKPGALPVHLDGRPATAIEHDADRVVTGDVVVARTTIDEYREDAPALVRIPGDYANG